MAIRILLRRFVGLACLGVAFAGSFTWAGGPTDLDPSGVPVRWIPARLGYVIDNGPLGSSTRDQAAIIVRAAFKVWEDADTSTIAFDDLGFLNVDVDISNYDAFFSKRPEGNVIIFDNDGSIISDYLGEGSEDVLGFANAVPAGNSNRYSFAFAVLNGLASDDPNFQGTITHEFGHMIGLDHTQAGMEQAFNGTTDDNPNVPIMFPFRVPFAPNDLRPDDKAWVSWLYPVPDFAQTTGTIRGQVFYPPGTPLPGANVVAVQVTTAINGSVTESKREILSVVSDFLVRGDGSFEIPGISPGDYVVFVEPLFPDFIQGSGVGPFDDRFENFVKDYYNATAESDQDDPDEKVAFSVAAGQVVTGINLVANQIFNRLDLLTDDGEMLFKFPDGFSFPFFGKIYTEVFVNSDGNLTFEKGDGIPGIPRDPDRFLSGPPRIAPLFSDLNPSETGQVTATPGSGEITFTWDGVSEFAESGTPPPNRFSVTLFSSGNIRFSYPQLAITPDPDERFPGGLQAVVGITPGGGAAGQTVDLSASPSIQVNGKPIYEVFPGTSLDLSGIEINFISSAAQLLFPFYAGNALTFSGFAFTNHSAQDVDLQLEGRGADGSLLGFADNPHSETVQAQTQVAKLGSEFFGIPMSTVQSGWIRGLCTAPNVASFFQFGDGLAGPITKMDGSVAVTAQSKTLFFSRIYDGLAVFPTLSGSQNATTRISLVNPNSSPITVRFTFYAPTGQPVGSSAGRTIPANGFLLERVSTLVGLQTPLNDGYLRADVIQGDGAIGFELIELDQSLMGLNASYGNTGQVAYSAQLASGTDTGIGVFTSLKLVNTSTETRIVTITPYRGDGAIVSPPLANVVLQPNQTLQRDAGEMFAGSQAASILGSLVVEADGPGVIGDVVFGDPQTANYAAALPLQAVLFTRAIFSQVANGKLGADPSTDAFTGIALFNPNTQDAEVTVRVFDRTGNQVGNPQTITLGSRERISDLVENLIPGTSNLIQGYISVDSTRPLVAQQLFGNASLSFLSAVPPQVVQ
ncbi:MAG: matrixin family metalloprotease [Acidobacteriota bacterium]